jgi:ferritin-like metal-binding protein YciE
MARTTTKTTEKKAQQNGQSKTQSNNKSNGTAGSQEKKGAAKTNGKSQVTTLDNLLEDGLKDIYSAEMQLLEALPEMAEAAYNEDLQDAFHHHYEQTKRHVERLDKVFARLNVEPGEENCEAMEGLIQEGKEIIEKYEEGPVRDSALIIAAQKVEHYEIASYGSLCELCDVLGYHRLGELLGRTLDEEESTDNELTHIAISVNDEACENHAPQKNGKAKNFGFSKN